MKPPFVLIITFIIASFSIRLIDHQYDIPLAARIAMSVMLLFTSSAHFAFTKGMTMMIPSRIPYKKELVYATGVFEILAAIGLMIPAFTRLTAGILIIFFLLMLPANINAAIHNVDYQKGNFEGNDIRYLWFRVPLQLLFIAWIWLSVFYAW